MPLPDATSKHREGGVAVVVVLVGYVQGRQASGVRSSARNVSCRRRRDRERGGGEEGYI